MTVSRHGRTALVALVVAAVAVPVLAHNIGEGNAAFVQSLTGPALAAFTYLGAKHMVTGVDHILFLVGVVFYLHRLKDVVLYATLFTIGHSATLLAGVLAEWSMNAYIVDAIIGLSVVYKAYENIGGFENWRWSPDPRAAVLVFGLCHGMGLATKLQELTLSADGLLVNLASFNIGVELGQVIALCAVVAILAWWRRQESFERSAYGLNFTLMVLGFILAEYQLAGYLLSTNGIT